MSTAPEEEVTTAETTVNQGRISRLKAAAKKKFKDDNPDRTFVVALLGLLSGALIALFLLVLFIYATIDVFGDDSPSYFRGILLVFSAFFAAALMSPFFDGSTKYDMFDFVWAAVTAVLAILVDIYLLATEIDRWVDCPPGNESTVDFIICSTFNSQVSTVPWISSVIAFFTILGIIFLIIWWYRFEKWKTGNAETARKVRAGLQSVTNVGIGVLAAVTAGIIAITAIVSMFPVDGFKPAEWVTAFYHGNFLLFPALYAGMEMAFFAVAPKSWQWFCFAIGIVSFISLAIGLGFEIPRLIDCANATVPALSFDGNICYNEGKWRAYWLPVVLIIVAILEVIMFILSCIRLFKKEPTVTAEETETLIDEYKLK